MKDRDKKIPITLVKKQILIQKIERLKKYLLPLS